MFEKLCRICSQRLLTSTNINHGNTTEKKNRILKSIF